MRPGIHPHLPGAERDGFGADRNISFRLYLPPRHIKHTSRGHYFQKLTAGITIVVCIRPAAQVNIEVSDNSKPPNIAALGMSFVQLLAKSVAS